jgi:cAMP-dependent protein kinase regulator
MQGVDTVVSTIDQHGASFGELSLMYGKPRTATVKCTQSGWLWALDRKAFRGVLVERMAHDNLIKVKTVTFRYF